MIDHFETWHWVVAIVAALLAGIAKTGFNGAGTLTAAMFANILPAKAASGVVLPLLIVADLVAVVIYRRQMDWRYFWRLFPWALAGIAVGYFAMGRIDDTQAKVVTGVIIVVLVAVHTFRRWQADKKRGQSSDAAAAPPATADTPKTFRGFGALMGVLAGFTTLVANAAGPLVTLYFLAMRLPKIEFVATGAIFFMVVNWVKVPFMLDLGLIHADSLRFNAMLIPAVLLGTLLGRLLLARVDQRTFETIALVLGAVAGVKLMLG